MIGDYTFIIGNWCIGIRIKKGRAMIDKSLYDGDLVFLSGFDPEIDAIIEAKWSYNPFYSYYLAHPMRPMSPEDIKKRYERLINRTEETENNFIFAVKLISENRLIGIFAIDRIAWTHGSADFTLAVGDRSLMVEPVHEALQLGLIYAFLELNLSRVCMRVPDFDTFTIKFLEQAGFIREISQREAEYFDNRYWDLHYYGLLKEEWEERGYHA
jgi:RimJ/RimL family protein N-acetyltransferase